MVVAVGQDERGVSDVVGGHLKVGAVAKLDLALGSSDTAVVRFVVCVCVSVPFGMRLLCSLSLFDVFIA